VITRDDIERALTEIVRKVNGTDPATAGPERFAGDMSLYDDLGVDSLAMVELTEEVEDRYSVKIPEERAYDLKTFGDAVDYVGSLVT
jgi:acyl carrier protein